MSIPQTIESFLLEHQIGFESIHHRRDFTAQETAADTHTKGRTFAKTVVLFADNQYHMVVVPAMCQVDTEKMRKHLNASQVTLATEDELKTLCPNCEIGAMPPFGPLYHLPVYVSHLFKNDDLITFNGGTHEDVIRMRFEDFVELVQPRMLDATHEDSL